MIIEINIPDETSKKYIKLIATIITGIELELTTLDPKIKINYKKGDEK